MYCVEFRGSLGNLLQNGFKSSWVASDELFNLLEVGVSHEHAEDVFNLCV